MIFALTALLAHAADAAPEPPPSDLKTAQDHPVLQRFSGSMLVGYRQQDWAATTLPSAAGATQDGKLANPVALEGKVTRLLYTAPKGKAPLEVFRNYQQALSAAGFKTSYLCDDGERGCSNAYFALDVAHRRLDGMERSSKYIAAGSGSSSYGLAPTFEEGRVLAGTLTRNGATLHMVLFTAYAANKSTDTAATYVEIVEPKAMQTGQVTVDSKAIGQGLQAEGKVALYGLFFDTGKAEIKPDSKPQLGEMAKMLEAQPSAKVFIVGHTDNVGMFDANLALSLARAQAVVAALGAPPYKIDLRRLTAKGAANISPVSSNASEEGRAKNRRVEMVLQ
jgi:outer membrane protein OmpA-like peptidoglycan-associated protein